MHYIECSKCCKIDSIKEYENKWSKSGE
jgi:hypothetical protein